MEKPLKKFSPAALFDLIFFRLRRFLAFFFACGRFLPQKSASSPLLLLAGSLKLHVFSLYTLCIPKKISPAAGHFFSFMLAHRRSVDKQKNKKVGPPQADFFKDPLSPFPQPPPFPLPFLGARFWLKSPNPKLFP